MKAITLWQPWASLMAEGTKRNETRSWSTKYRGDIVICSAKRKAVTYIDDDVARRMADMPMGVALCVVELFDVIPSDQCVKGSFDSGKISFENKMIVNQAEWAAGDYSLGRHIWVTRNLRLLRPPVPVTGRQMIFELPNQVVRAIERQLT